MDDDDYEDEIWFWTGSAECADGQDEKPRLRSVSPAAHRAFQIGRQSAPKPRPRVGFHRPPVR